MTKKELIKALEKYEDYDVVVCVDQNGGWNAVMACAALIFHKLSTKSAVQALIKSRS